MSRHRDFHVIKDETQNDKLFQIPRLAGTTPDCSRMCRDIFLEDEKLNYRARETVRNVFTRQTYVYSCDGIRNDAICNYRRLLGLSFSLSLHVLFKLIVIENHFDEEIFSCYSFKINSFFTFFKRVENIHRIHELHIFHSTHKFLYLIDLKKHSQSCDDSERHRISPADQRFLGQFSVNLSSYATNAISFELRRLGSSTTFSSETI